MNLYLLRHGEATSPAENPTRPLSPEGRAQIEAVAALAARIGVQPAEIRHSGLTRAAETAEIVAAALRPRPPVSTSEALSPEEEPQFARREIETAGRSLLLVGHLPHLERLVSLLLTDDPNSVTARFPTGGFAVLRRDGTIWSLVALVGPALLRR